MKFNIGNFIRNLVSQLNNQLSGYNTAIIKKINTISNLLSFYEVLEMILVIFNVGWMLHSELHSRKDAISHVVKGVT